MITVLIKMITQKVRTAHKSWFIWIVIDFTELWLGLISQLTEDVYTAQLVRNIPITG